ncbi:YceI family protein [Undibacterium arcticum]
MSLRKALLVGLVSICAASTAADRYRIDPQHSFCRFHLPALGGLSTQDVRFDNTVGTIELDPVAGTGTIDLVIDAASVSSGVDAFNKTLRSAEFF